MLDKNELRKFINDTSKQYEGDPELNALSDIISKGFANEYAMILKKFDVIGSRFGSDKKKFIAKLLITGLISKVYDNTDEIFTALEEYKGMFITIEKKFNQGIK